MNQDKTRLRLPEYGRNVQKMVNYLKTIPDREARNRQAEVVVAIMGNLYPASKEGQGFNHMLWDHLFVIADFELDVDSPYPWPTPEMFAPVPTRVPYTQSYVRQKQYGSNVRRMLQSLASDTTTEPELRDEAVANIAGFMKLKSCEYNREITPNSVIVGDISAMSDGALELNAGALDNTTIDLAALPKNNTSGGVKKKNNKKNYQFKKYPKK